MKTLFYGILFYGILVGNLGLSFLFGATIEPGDSSKRHKTDYTASWTANENQTYRISASASGCSFVDSKTKAGGGATLEDGHSSSGASAKKMITHTETPNTSDFGFSVSGVLSGSGGGSEITWSATLQQRFFWLEASPELIVKRGTAVTVSANGSPTESTWSINNASWKDHTKSGSEPYKTSSITLNRNMWDKMKWTPNPVPEGFLFPTPGSYSVSATTTEKESARSANLTVKVIGIKQISVSSITSTTDKPGEKESLLVDAHNKEAKIDETKLKFTATADPGSEWPDKYPKWKVNGKDVQTGGNTYVFSTKDQEAGKYVVSAECGNIVAIDVYVVSCDYQIIVDTPGTGAITIDFSAMPPAYSVGHASWKLNVLPSEAIDIEPLKTYKDILRKNIGFHADANVIKTGLSSAPTPSLHIPDAAAGKLRSYTIPLSDLLAGAAHTNTLKTAAGDYRLGTRCIATKTVLGVTVTPISWTHGSSRNCATLATGAGTACGVTLPGTWGMWSGSIAGFWVEYDGEMPYELHRKL